MKLFKPFLIIVCFPFLAQSQTKETFAVYFNYDKYQLTDKALYSIDSFWNINRGQPMNFEVVGHCDSRGTDDYNQILSEKRALAVRQNLVNRGIKNENIKRVIGAGEKEPLNNNSNEEEMQVNRRVDITVIKNISENEKKTAVEKKEEKPTTLKEKIADSATTVGTNIVLRNLNFVGGMHQILPESESILNELLDAMKTYPKLVIRIEGHICCMPGPEDGLDAETNIRNLSTARAIAIREYLIGNGIDANRISIQGFGHSRPLYPYPEQTEEERTANRRVEIKILSK